ncbi:MAG: hypothetical protein LBG18_06120 [Mediterranea sp.]|jgi:hypothetical protein|nr:hypothetical protein [Mediterranea sp.]
MNAASVLKNIVYLVLVLFLVRYTLSKQPGYRWVYDMLRSNMETVRKHPGLTFEQKMQQKLGMSYVYLLHLKQATPEDAVILYPAPEAFKEKDSPFTQEIYNKIYATRFLYPRRIIRTDEPETGKYAGRITHVAIVNGIGADRLPYPVDPAVRHGVFPITPRKK